MLSFITQLISRIGPIRYLFEQPVLSGGIAKWQLLLAKRDIMSITQKAIKGQVIVDHLVDNQVEDYEQMTSFFTDKSILVIEPEDPN